MKIADPDLIQRELIQDKTQEFLDKKQPVISIYWSGRGTLWCLEEVDNKIIYSGDPSIVFPNENWSEALSYVAPYGVYKMSSNGAFINLGEKLSDPRVMEESLLH